MRLCCLLLILALYVPAQSSEFAVRRSRDWTSSGSDGACAFKISVDDEAFFVLKGERLTMLGTKGAPPRDVATECSSPLPSNAENVRLGKVEGRGEATLHDEPSAKNNWSAVIRVVDSKSGSEEFQFRLDWGRAASNKSNDELEIRDVSRWSTRDIRPEIERIYQDVNRRKPTSTEVDDYIDKIRNDRWILRDVRREIERRR